MIRTATLDESGEESVVGVRAGAGLVADSDPAAEYEETEQKMDGVLTAIDRIREGDESDAEGDDADPIATGSEAER